MCDKCKTQSNRIVLAGGSGVLGGLLARALAAKGYDIVRPDSLPAQQQRRGQKGRLGRADAGALARGAGRSGGGDQSDRAFG